MKPIFGKYHVDAFICGHEHSLQDIRPEDPTHYFISGAGSETPIAILLPDIGRFDLSENGFTAFSRSMEKMLAQIISYRGNILITFNTPAGNR